MSNEEVRVLIVGLESVAAESVDTVLAGSTFERITTSDDFAARYEQWSDDTFDVIVCGSGIADLSGNEMAQVLLNQCPGTIKYFVTISTANYEPRVLLKNGFTGTFNFPMDFPIFKKSVLENVLGAKRKDRSFRTVRVMDLGSGDKLGFETFIFLPKNKKYIRYTSADAPVEPSKIQKLQEHQMGQLWVDHRDMNKFYQYSAKKLRDLGDMSSTEKQEKLRDSVRSLFTDIFDVSVKADFEQGKEVIKQCESIISNYVTKGASSNWYQKLMSAIGESDDTYNHASNVSTFAALFAIGIGHKRPEDLAMAGLFHDLGLTQLPHHLQNITSAEDIKDPKEKELYYSHAEKSVNLVKNKRIILPDAVEKAILQHHEQYSGRGFPKQVPGNRVSTEALILSFADQFDYLTRYEEGKTRLAPLEALEAIRENGSISPELISQIRRVLDTGQSTVTKSA